MSSPAIVARFIDWNEAHMARGLLESNGIACRLGDNNTVAADWGYALAIGGIKLLVLDLTDAPEALRLLDDVRRGELRRGLQQFDAAGLDEADDAERCPSCRSADIFRARSPLSAVITALFSAPMLLPSRQRHCRACGAEWTAAT